MQVSNQLLSSLFGNSPATNTNNQSQSNDKQMTGAMFDFKDVFQNSLDAHNSVDISRTSQNYNKSAVVEDSSTSAPYSYLADENGVINYNGVTFQCNGNSLCLGDMSDKNNVLTIPLSGGGTLQVNRNNLNDLAKAIGMFSPQDVKRILDAIATDAKTKSKNVEINNVINKTFASISSNSF